MNKVELFEHCNRLELCREINDFAKTHKIIDVSLATSKAGYTFYYTALVLYRAED